MSQEEVSASMETTAAPREPWRAANLSMLFPGLGQWDAGHLGAALLFAVATVVGYVASIAFLLAPGLPGWIGFLGVLVVLGLYVGAIVDAHRRVAAANSPEQEEVRTSSRDAWKTVFLNRFVPGIGHAYEGRWVAAALWFISFVATMLLPPPWDGLFAGMVLGAALWTGWARTRARPVADTSLIRPLVVAAAVLTAAGTVAPAWLRDNVVRAFRVPSASMQPTIVPGDYLYVDMRPFAPRLGDLVVCAWPQDPEQLFVKRVLALPGDVVEFKLDGAYRNGSRVMPGPVASDPSQLAGMLGAEGHAYRVPRHQVFLVGDNLPNSNDSRHHGTMAIAALRGRVFKTYWPPGRARSFP